MGADVGGRVGVETGDSVSGARVVRVSAMGGRVGASKDGRGEGPAVGAAVVVRRPSTSQKY